MRTYQSVNGPDRLPQAMVEGSTEFDWAELPDYLKDIIRGATAELVESQERPIAGEIVNELKAMTGE